MKRSTARWTTALAVMALFALPASALAQQGVPATSGQSTDQSTAKSSPQDPAPTPSPQEPKPAGNQAPAPQGGAPGAPEPAQPPATPPDAAPPAQPAAGQVDTATVKRHLSAARESLSALTQLPAAAQLTGDARTQISQLITNFNELITTNVDWRAAYAKVDANLTALIGERADASAAPAAGTPGAVGTSGAPTIDPAIRAKLVEFRTHLTEFEKAASGGSAPARSSLEPAADAPPSPAATTGSPAATPAPTATTGAPAEPQAAAAQPGDSKQAGHSEALRHIDAIEAILGGQSAAAAGPAGAANPSLDPAQIEQIKKHLTELRRALGQGER